MPGRRQNALIRFVTGGLRGQQSSRSAALHTIDRVPNQINESESICNSAGTRAQCVRERVELGHAEEVRERLLVSQIIRAEFAAARNETIAASDQSIYVCKQICYLADEGLG